jgi:hypothetical protein
MNKRIIVNTLSSPLCLVFQMQWWYTLIYISLYLHSLILISLTLSYYIKWLLHAVLGSIYGIWEFRSRQEHAWVCEWEVWRCWTHHIGQQRYVLHDDFHITYGYEQIRCIIYVLLMRSYFWLHVKSSVYGDFYYFWLDSKKVPYMVAFWRTYENNLWYE